MPNLLIGVTGSVAAVKLPILVQRLISLDKGIAIRVIVTKSACHFVDLNQIRGQGIDVFTDENEWSEWKSLSDPVLHIELRKWADVMLIAPLDANTMAKMASGICDNLLTCVVRAWDLNRPLIYCPAMNTLMWDHPLTARHRTALSEFGYREIEPVVKKLACGDFGAGAMAEVETIVQTVVSLITGESFASDSFSNLYA